MAFSGLGSNGAGRGRRRYGGSLSEMNVVPLVDVVLVLLIIFMLTASVMEFGLEVEVPEVKQSRTTADEVAAVLAITRGGELYLNDRPININTIGDAVRERFPDTKDVFLRADRNTTYEVLAQVVSELGASKLSVKLVTKTEDIRGKQR
jgi:biopolymer transport protein ExbD